ncbi:MAG: BatD family protein [Proteobacteria bacterium]|nr:BatD family protein [Pseudomonadota bacterium]
MRTRLTHWSKLLVLLLGLLAPIAPVHAADLSLAYESIEPSSIRIGDTAIIRVTSLDGYLDNVPLPSVTGLKFEFVAHQQGFEFVAGKPIPSSYVYIRVTPEFVGVFTIPGLTPKSRTLGLEVVAADNPNPSAWRTYKQNPPPPAPKATASLPKGAELKAGGAAFVRLVVPSRSIYVGESVPVDIEVGLRPGIVTSLNGLPTLTGGDFTLNNLSRQPERRDEVIGGNPFTLMTWHSVLAAVKPGDFSLSVAAPLSVKINTLSREDISIAAQMGAPFLQGLYNGIKPKDLTIASPPSDVRVLSLPTEGRPKDFTGAVGGFQVASEISPAHPAAGDPLTLRLRVSGAGNFDRVDSPMLSELEHWKTYPPRSSFKKDDAVGYKGEKVFEQPLITAQTGDQTIPGLDFSYFNPNTKRYERAQTQPIKITIGTSLADRSGGSVDAAALTRGLRPDHPRSNSLVGDLEPLYFQRTFLAVPTALALILAGILLLVRPSQARVNSKVTARALAKLDAAARSGNPAAFFEAARNTLVQTFAARWNLPPDRVTAEEIRAQLGPGAEDLERLWALADEAKYSRYEPGSTDFQHWVTLVHGQVKES